MMFVSKKKYNELSKELDKQKAINKQLKQLSDSFEDFYKDVKQLPRILKTENKIITISESQTVDSQIVSQPNAADIIKHKIADDFVKDLMDNGVIHFDLVTNGRYTALKAYLNVAINNGYNTNNII